ncbi:RelA/SpoT family protein [Bryobacter aggregatus]|uniref:RelA/SpoT family protein n=1 Tax=Bryobacter aggregatus TaxID=360054 RepID=UPI000B188DA8|nr:bifunctional (p)ppGpp synthetase/guanosine-3',5'-bis(diphosphate) 3'-pyrophosphohydrolase [Bryobacter aggregatus]
MEVKGNEAEKNPLPDALRYDALVEQRFVQLEKVFAANRPKEDLTKLRIAFEFARDRHGLQTRKSGEPYILHPIAVAQILADMQMDLVTVETALLHDVVEDTGTGIDEIQKLFGNEVAACVDGVTKLGKIHLYSREEQQAESVRKMLLAMVSDIRVIIVKLADRLHNLHTIDSLSREKQTRIGQETLDIYAPIAHRLGMGKMRSELEDLAFHAIDPEAHADIVGQIENKRKASQEFLDGIRKILEQKLARESIPARVEGRLKRPYSVYLKLKKQKIPIEQVYDLLALRIITDSLKNCYAALGVIHNEWPPIPGRIKDFIAMPRQNGYQSLHTSVMGNTGQAFEVQIRTEEMHRLAEEGVAAHWKYKEGQRHKSEEEQYIKWMRQLVEWQQEMRDPGEFMSTLKVDLYSDEVYVFTPKGKVVVLPRDSTPVDFAYAIHSDVGNACVGAKVNNRIVPLRYALRNGDVAEVLTQPGHMPSKDWLSFVKTSKARNKIKQIINATERSKAIEIGEKYFEKEARRLSIPISKLDEDILKQVLEDYGVGKLEDLYANLGYGKIEARPILIRFSPEHAAQEEARVQELAAQAPVYNPADKELKNLALRVKGVNDVLLYRASCCNPIPGEPIVGYITRGKGVAVHSINCTNVQNLLYEVERKIDVEWAKTGVESFDVQISIMTDDRPGMLAQFTQVLFSENSNIRTLEARGDMERDGDGAVVEMKIEVRDQRQLDKILSALRRIPGVRDIERKA